LGKLGHLGKLLGEFWAFAWQNKAWWMIPIVAIMLVLGILIATGQVAAPFIYTLF